jgi:proteasome lid subunit RPN8/RPN11
MNYSIQRTLRHLWSPRHELACGMFVWNHLLRRLRERGDGRRESGAFLLGSIDDEARVITDFILYDDIDPHALDKGYVHLNGASMGKLWTLCRERTLQVVADVHTHPGGPEQSESDQLNPMISVAGHISLIVPNFAFGRVRRDSLGIYCYQGGRQWHTVKKNERSDFFYVGI